MIIPYVSTNSSLPFRKSPRKSRLLSAVVSLNLCFWYSLKNWFMCSFLFWTNGLFKCSRSVLTTLAEDLFEYYSTTSEISGARKFLGSLPFLFTYWLFNKQLADVLFLTPIGAFFISDLFPIPWKLFRIVDWRADFYPERVSSPIWLPYPLLRNSFRLPESAFKPLNSGEDASDPNCFKISEIRFCCSSLSISSTFRLVLFASTKLRNLLESKIL